MVGCPKQQDAPRRRRRRRSGAEGRLPHLPRAEAARSTAQRGQGPESLRDLFEKLDKNGDKKVTAVELRKGLKDLGFRLDDDEVRDIIKYCDVDGDGEISYLEFESFVESPECKDADVQDVLDRLREIAEGQGGSIAKE